MKRFIPLLLALLAFTASCKSPEEKMRAKFLKQNPTGVIHAQIPIRGGNGSSYALYIPTSYEPGKPTPVVYCFDPHGNGKLPLELMKDEAEKLGYILIGSNDSKNGMQWNEIEGIINTMLADTRKKLNLDIKRTYAAGFSGGARVALNYATTVGEFKGVISCSAAIEPYRILAANIDLLVIAGIDDMNYRESFFCIEGMKDDAGVHLFLSFDGKHQWPPKDMLATGLQLFNLRAMKNGQIPNDEKLIADYTRRIKTFISDTNSIGRYDLNRTLAVSLLGLSNIEKYTETLGFIKNDYGCKTEREEYRSFLTNESKLQNELYQALSKENIVWWQKRIAELSKDSLQIANKNQMHMSKRLIAYISLASYSQVNGALGANDLEQAKKAISIYGLVDPKNPDYHYFNAAYLALINQPDKAVEELKTSISLGFTDFPKLESDPLFSSLHENAAFKSLLK
jgi:hypothetical protein